MQRPIEAPELYGVVAIEEAVQIEEMVAAVVVVPVPAPPVAFVPDALDLRKGFWFYPVHPLYQIGVHLFAVAHPLRRNLQGFVEQVVVAGDDVDKVADTARRVVGTVQMDVDAAGVIGETACPA